MRTHVAQGDPRRAGELGAGEREGIRVIGDEAAAVASASRDDLLVVLNSFNSTRIASWPVTGFSLQWWGRAFTSQPVRDALLNSVLVATGATAIALVLGTLPLWIMNQMARPNEANVVNVVATVVILASFIPVWVSQRLSRDIGDRG